MSGESIEVVRQPMSARSAPRRSPEEQLGVRAPGLLALVTRGFLMLPPRSRARQAFLRRMASLAIAAANRGDFDAAFCLFDPRVELLVPPGLASMGLQASVHGRDERKRFEGTWRTEWGDFAYVADELFDLGDRVLVVGRMVGSGSSSGATFESEWADLLTISAGGRVLGERVFLDHAEALAFVGLPGETAGARRAGSRPGRSPTPNRR